MQGERDTSELNNKLAQFSENAMKFTMDGGISAYDYKAEEDDMEDGGLDGARIKQLAGSCCAVSCCSEQHLNLHRSICRLVRGHKG